ncbi:MAG: hypothetical protein ACM3IK_07760 [Sphingomonadaceae bacterium]
MRAWLAALLLAAAPAWAAPFAVQLGGTRLGLDAPPGFADTSFTGSPRLQEMGESLTSASNKILLFAISDSDLRAFSQGDTPLYRRYMIVVTPRDLVDQQVSTTQFSQLVADALRGVGPAAPDENYPAYLERQPAGQTALLAELHHGTTMVSLLQGMRLPPLRQPGVIERLFDRKEPSRYAISTSTLLLLKGKALNLSVFSGYDSPEDVDWIKATTRRWVADLERLNRN